MWTNELDSAFDAIFNAKPTSAFDKVLTRLKSRSDGYEKGDTRAAVISTFVVYKIPINDKGKEANRTEYEMFKRYGQYGRLAPCRLLRIEGVEVLAMRKLDTNVVDIPDWIPDTLCAQIGYDRKGRLMTFDYAPD